MCGDMQTSRKGKIALAVSEGIVTTAYYDNAKPPVLTGGIGHTKSAGGYDPKIYIDKQIPLEEIFDVFAEDLVKYEDIVKRNVVAPLKQNEFDALVHFVYNIGEPNFKKSKLLKALNKGDKAWAWQEGFHGWLVPPSLRSRRDKERQIAQVGAYGTVLAPLYNRVTYKLKPIRTGSIDLSTIDLGD